VPITISTPKSGAASISRYLSIVLKPSRAAAVGAVCAAVGVFALSGSVTALSGIWTDDALKSVGMAVPFVCFALILRDWRDLGWETEGTWWGFALLTATALLMFFKDQMLFSVTVNKDWLLQLPPLPLIAVIYAVSLVLLFGGPRLLKTAWFPVLLMWAVIPVPQTFSRRVDVPLQHAGAVVARGFAHLIGVRLNSGDLRIMFSPETGMFIAPGCDGLRGSITMGLTAVAVAYYNRFRWYVFLPVVAGGVLLGYLFNFLRLCSMVIYDRITVSHPSLGPHEQLADHIVGGCIFVLALFIFFGVIEKLKRAAPEPMAPRDSVPATPIFAKAFAVVVLASVFGADYMHRSYAEHMAPSTYPAMPQTIGGYRLVRTWLDQAPDTSVVVYTWGEYVGPDKSPGVAGDHVSVGVSPYKSIHDAELCHIARGDDPTWHGQIVTDSAGRSIEMAGVMYNNGATQMLEAATVCDGGACRQYSQAGEHVTVVYSAPDRNVPLSMGKTRPVPVILKVETPNVDLPMLTAEKQMQGEMELFLKQTDLAMLTKPFSQR
jgi:exosortase J